MGGHAASDTFPALRLPGSAMCQALTRSERQARCALHVPCCRLRCRGAPGGGGVVAALPPLQAAPCAVVVAAVVLVGPQTGAARAIGAVILAVTADQPSLYGCSPLGRHTRVACRRSTSLCVAAK